MKKILITGANSYIGTSFENFIKEANTGKGLKMPTWLRPYLTYVLPVVIMVVFVIGILTFEFADNFTILNWLKNL